MIKFIGGHKRKVVIAAIAGIVAAFYFSGAYRSHFVLHGKPSTEELVEVLNRELEIYERILTTGDPEPVLIHSINFDQRQRFLQTLIDKPSLPVTENELREKSYLRRLFKDKSDDDFANRFVGTDAQVMRRYLETGIIPNDIQVTAENIQRSDSLAGPRLVFDLLIVWPGSAGMVEKDLAKADFWKADGGWQVKLLDTPDPFARPSRIRLAEGCNPVVDSCKRNFYYEIQSEEPVWKWYLLDLVGFRDMRLNYPY